MALCVSCEAGRGPRLVVGANWRLENAKSPVAMIQEINPDTTCTSIPYAPDMLLYLRYMYLSQVLCLQSFCLYYDESARTRGVLDVDGWKKQLKKTHTAA